MASISIQATIFNPRSRTGSDPVDGDHINGASRLQSTLPHGERRMTSEEWEQLKHLQSTLPHGERREWMPCSAMAAFSKED